MIYAAEAIDLFVCEFVVENGIIDPLLYDAMCAFGNLRLAQREDWEDIVATWWKSR